MIGSLETISLYFHIPFCTRKCDYCHFYVLPDQEKLKDQLLEGFFLEWRLLQPLFKGKKIITVYFGGGTPSLFGPARLSSLIELIRKEADLADSAEITLEVNPENVTLKLIKSYANAGINRVSLGIQTLDPDLLQLLGRLHSPNIALNAIDTVYEAGISNISIDLMYDLPNQTLQHWIATLQGIKPLPLSHLSLYNLTIEPHTLFFKNQSHIRSLLPDEEASLAMYESAIEHLENMGLLQYEISAFAKPGHESKHNTGYWMGRQFLGLGPSAFSYWERKRFRNIAHLGKYTQALQSNQSPVDFEEQLDPSAHLRELFVIQLRLRQGVNMQNFTSQHGQLDSLTLVTMQRLVHEGYLYYEKDQCKLTKRGILFYDTVAAELI